MSKFRRGAYKGAPSKEMLAQELTSFLNLLSGWLGMTVSERKDLTTSISNTAIDVVKAAGPTEFTVIWAEARRNSIDRRPEPLPPEVAKFLDGVGRAAVG